MAVPVYFSVCAEDTRPGGKVLEEALEISETLATGSQLTIRWTKRALSNWLKTVGPICDESVAYEVL